MTRFFLLVAALFQAIAVTSAFAPVAVQQMQRQQQQSTRVFAGVDEETKSDSSLPNLPRFAERGVSVDQDGKSNVWAIEPKMEVSTKSSEEQTSSALVAGGGIAAFAVVAGLILTNLPDPNQF